MTLQTEILSTETSDFLQQMFFLKSFNSVIVLKFQVFMKNYKQDNKQCVDMNTMTHNEQLAEISNPVCGLKEVNSRLVQ